MFSIVLFVLLNCEIGPLSKSRKLNMSIHIRECEIVENIRQEILHKIWVRVTVYRQLWIPVLLSLAAYNLASTLFWLQSQLLNLPDVYSLQLQILWYKHIAMRQLNSAPIRVLIPPFLENMTDRHTDQPTNQPLQADMMIHTLVTMNQGW